MIKSQCSALNDGWLSKQEKTNLFQNRAYGGKKKMSISTKAVLNALSRIPPVSPVPSCRTALVLYVTFPVVRVSTKPCTNVTKGSSAARRVSKNGKLRVVVMSELAGIVTRFTVVEICGHGSNRSSKLNRLVMKAKNVPLVGSSLALNNVAVPFAACSTMNSPPVMVEPGWKLVPSMKHTSGGCHGTRASIWHVIVCVTVPAGVGEAVGVVTGCTCSVGSVMQISSVPLNLKTVDGSTTQVSGPPATHSYRSQVAIISSTQRVVPSGSTEDKIVTGQKVFVKKSHSHVCATQT
mmetsp:Transcript_8728/g.15759  ORF Transcript_8728/g.15759 Transcript_8728/m.15759 type:complete len:293 (-) Transcript_8728:182-1060(-)